MLNIISFEALMRRRLGSDFTNNRVVRMRWRSVPAVALIFFLCSAIHASALLGHTEPDGTSGAASSESRPRGLHYRQVSFEINLVSDTVPGAYAGFETRYAIFECPDHPDVADSLNRVVARFIHDDSIARTLTDDSACFLPVARTLLEGCEELTKGLGWTWGFHEGRFADVVRDSLGLLSVLLSSDRFAGGVHPVSYGRYKHFDKRNGSEITVDLLLNPDAALEFDSRAERFFRERYELPEEGAITEGFYFSPGAFHVNGNFSVEHDGLRFHLNPYEDCSYASQGSYLVPYTAFRDLIRHDGPLGFVVGGR